MLKLWPTITIKPGFDSFGDFSCWKLPENIHSIMVQVNLFM